MNKLTSLPKIDCVGLRHLKLDENEIASVDLTNHKALETLSLNKNKLTSCKEISYIYELNNL